MTKAGIGIIIVNDKGKILILKRKGNHAPYYSIPGGKLDDGETFEDCAIREAMEEMNITISKPEVIAVTNNLDTYRNEGVHYISVVLLTRHFSGTPKIMEPDKCNEVVWADPRNLPMPHFEASKKAVDCWLHGCFYRK